jgi:hypothetical protein
MGTSCVTGKNSFLSEEIPPGRAKFNSVLPGSSWNNLSREREYNKKKNQKTVQRVFGQKQGYRSLDFFKNRRINK